MTAQEKKPYTLTQLANEHCMTRTAIYQAIYKGRLNAQKKNRKWLITPEDFDAYRATKYSREFSKFNGKPLYQSEHQELSVRQAAKYFGKKDADIYYLVRKGRIPHEKRGAAFILKFEDVKRVLIDQPQMDIIEFAKKLENS